MSKQPPKIDWQIATTDAEWEQLRSQSNQPPASPPHWRLPAYGWWFSCLLAVIVAGWAWRNHLSEPPPLEPPATAVPALANSPSTGTPTVVLPVYDFWSDQAVARLLTHPEEGVLVYQSTTSGPLRTALDGAFWGPRQQLATPHFRFWFRQRDRTAVTGAAARLERLYSAISANLGLKQAVSSPKLLVVVSVDQQQGTANAWPSQQGLIVRSPSFYPTSAEQSAADRLAQAVALPLIDHLLEQAGEQYGIGPEHTPLLHGLRLWQLWKSDLPLAHWRGEIVNWLLAAGQAPARPLPDRYVELCTAHQLWLAHPAELQVPLLCTKLDETLGQRDGQRVLTPPFALPRLIAPIFPDEEADNQGRTRSEPPADEAVAVALLIDYLVATYGQDTLPLLLAQAGLHDSWANLVPATLTLSVAEFEAGWRTYVIASQRP
jgi:hypothetical protein